MSGYLKKYHIRYYLILIIGTRPFGREFKKGKMTEKIKQKNWKSWKRVRQYCKKFAEVDHHICRAAGSWGRRYAQCRWLMDPLMRKKNGFIMSRAEVPSVPLGSWEGADVYCRVIKSCKKLITWNNPINRNPGIKFRGRFRPPDCLSIM